MNLQNYIFHIISKYNISHLHIFKYKSQTSPITCVQEEINLTQYNHRKYTEKQENNK